MTQKKAKHRVFSATETDLQASEPLVVAISILEMVFSQVIAGFHALVSAIGLPMNFLVIVTIALERRLNVMRYILLASLAVSDFLCLILTNSFRIGSIAQERWLYGQTMCHLNSFFLRYFYLNTVLHLIAISYERYSAIVKSPMTYNGTITKSRVVLMILIWVAPILLSIGPFVDFGQYVYNPEVFFCEQGWTEQHDSAARRKAIFAIAALVVPSLIIAFLNWKVFQAAKTVLHNVVQVGSIDGSNTSESQSQDVARSRSERKAAVDVCIIIATFMVCFLPGWTVGLCRQFLRSHEVPVEVIFVSNAIFFISTLCNPIIYSVRKREFRAGVKNVFRRMGVQCGSLDDTNNNQIGMNIITVRGNIGTGGSTTNPATAQPAQVSPPTAPQSAYNSQIGKNIITVRAYIGTGESTGRPAAPQVAQDQDESTRRAEVTRQGSRLSPIEELTH